MAAAAALGADGRGIDLLGRAHRNLARAVLVLGDGDAHLHALDLAGQRGDGVEVIHIRARAVDIRASDDDERDLAIHEKLHGVKDDALHLKARPGLNFKQAAVDLAAIHASLQAPRRAAQSIRNGVGIAEAAGVGGQRDIDTFRNVSGQRNAHRVHHIQDQLGACAGRLAHDAHGR